MSQDPGTGASREQVSRIPRFLWLTLQLALLLLVMERFHIQEGFGFLQLLPLIFGGFVLHAWLPMGLRLPCYTLISIASVFLVLPPVSALVLVAMALGLLGICHLPIAFRLRVVLLLLAAGALAMLRMGHWAVDETRMMETRLIPLLGAMFMYRIAVYMYDLNNEKKPSSIWERISYFFMLPNVSFLLFPVVDYTTYRRSHYKGEDFDIYQRGITWIYRGMTHLIAYRVIYQYIIPAPEAVEGLGGILLFMLTTYLLYLRVSGQFHIIVGLLCLFGFNLPETHRLYYLATSFNDFWRRINIYWKDYMLKLFFYPTFMRLRAHSMTTRLVLATIVVFAGTWLLHPYQQFWIRGSFPITVKDGVFWGVLGVLVIINSLHEAKGVKRRASNAAWELRYAYAVSLKTMGTFLFICILWSFWSAHTMQEWTRMVAEAQNSTPREWAALGLGLLACLHLGVLLNNAYTKGTKLQAWRLRLTPKDPRVGTLFGCTLLLAVTLPARAGDLPGDFGTLVANLREDRLNQHDEKLERRGYYEGLNDTSSFTSALAGRKSAPKGPEWVSIREAKIARMTEDFLEYELIPSHDGSWKDEVFVTNRWGMRDKPYAQQKPPGVFRIALVGASMEVAAGVQLRETYENVLEDCLTRDYGGISYERFEVLNFAVGGYSMVQKAIVVEERVAAFEPDLVLLTVHSTEERRLYNHLGKVLEQQREPPAYMATALARAGLRAGMGSDEIRERLIPVGDEILLASLEAIRLACERQGLPLLVAFLPLTDDFQLEDPYFKVLRGMTTHVGLETISVPGAFEGYNQTDLLLAPDWDRLHMNALGNRLLAEGFCEELAAYLKLENN